MALRGKHLQGDQANFEYIFSFLNPFSFFSFFKEWIFCYFLKRWNFLSFFEALDFLITVPYSKLAWSPCSRWMLFWHHLLYVKVGIVAGPIFRVVSHVALHFLCCFDHK